MRGKILIVVIAAAFAAHWVWTKRTGRDLLGHSTQGAWMTDASAAMEKARSQNRRLLMDFTGSDWCVWCERLDAEVFSTPEFTGYARDKLVLLKLDFPRKKQLSEAETQQNQNLAMEYHVSGFPTIVVLNPDGSLKGRLGYQPGGAKQWLASLDSLP